MIPDDRKISFSECGWKQIFESIGSVWYGPSLFASRRWRMRLFLFYIVNTVDGRNPAPVEVDSLSHYFPGGAGFLPSTVSAGFMLVFWEGSLDFF